MRIQGGHVLDCLKVSFMPSKIWFIKWNTNNVQTGERERVSVSGLQDWESRVNGMGILVCEPTYGLGVRLELLGSEQRTNACELIVGAYDMHFVHGVGHSSNRLASVTSCSHQTLLQLLCSAVEASARREDKARKYSSYISKQTTEKENSTYHVSNFLFISPPSRGYKYATGIENPSQSTWMIRFSSIFHPIVRLRFFFSTNQ